MSVSLTLLSHLLSDNDLLHTAGKKTFGNIFSKVKAKLQELETGKPANAQPAPAPSGSTTSQAYQAYQPHPQAQTWTPPHQQAAYFDPNSNSDPAAAPTLQGYDVCKYYL